MAHYFVYIFYAFINIGQVALEHTTIKWVFEIDPKEISKTLTAYALVLGPTSGAIGSILGARIGGKIRTATIGSLFCMDHAFLLSPHHNVICLDRCAGFSRSFSLIYEWSRLNIREGRLGEIDYGVCFCCSYARSLDLFVSWKSSRFRTALQINMLAS